MLNVSTVIVFKASRGYLDVLVERMLKLLNNNELRRKMGEKSKKIAINNFGDTTYKLVTFWQDIINNKI